MDTKYIVDDSGNRKAIILPMEKYEELLEDVHDLTVVAERKDETTISLEDLKKKLKADGLIQD